MNYTIDVSPQLSERLTQTAKARGVEPTKLLESLVVEFISPVISDSSATPDISAKNAAALAYLRKRLQDEASTDPEEIRKSDAEAEELLQSLNRNRIESGERPLIP